MRSSVYVSILFFLIIFLIADSNNYLSAEEDYVRAKIAIQIKSGDNTSRAKSIDRLKKRDLIRIYVHPEKTSHVYVVHTDLNKITLLNIVQQRIQSSTMVMPSLQEFYQVDGQSPKETITIIISPNELFELLNLLEDENIPYEKWAEYEKELIAASKVDLSSNMKKPFSVTGNVRGIEGNSDIDPFVSKLQIFSGKSILVKKYEFDVKK